jgi:hypothetical protein
MWTSLASKIKWRDDMTRKFLLLIAIFLIFLVLINNERNNSEITDVDKTNSEFRPNNEFYICEATKKDLELTKVKANVENNEEDNLEDNEEDAVENSAPIKTDQEIRPYLSVTETNLDIISYNLFLNDTRYAKEYYDSDQVFPDTYTELDGILTFRGNHLRNSPSFGTTDIQEKKLEVAWNFKTSISSWGGGAGWSGQPAIVRWPKEARQLMNLNEAAKLNDALVEVIYASLDGYVYFLDLETGMKTRSHIKVNNPLKGSLSLDPRGYPLLYVGEGIPESRSIGYNIYSLIDHSKLYYVNGLDPLAFRRWGAFDSSALINKDTDTLLLGGENGLFYHLKLNTSYDANNKSIHVDPVPLKYRYKIKNNPYQGIENSVAAYKNLLYFADNGGSIQALNLLTMKPIWALAPLDDTDATITLEVEDNVPFLYTGTEVDHQGSRGYAHLRKINGLTGELIWQVRYKCYTDPKVNGGMLATNVIGKHNSAHLVIFTLARYNQFNGGLMVALDKKTGEEVWTWTMPNYAWSSPVDFYDEEGNMYLIQSDSKGNMHLLDGLQGKLLHTINLGANIEASPAIFENTIVVATRAQKIVGVKIK